MKGRRVEGLGVGGVVVGDRVGVRVMSAINQTEEYRHTNTVRTEIR